MPREADVPSQIKDQIGAAVRGKWRSSTVFQLFNFYKPIHRTLVMSAEHLLAEIASILRVLTDPSGGDVTE
jgi:hypothetical protein